MQMMLFYFLLLLVNFAEDAGYQICYVSGTEIDIVF